MTQPADLPVPFLRPVRIAGRRQDDAAHAPPQFWNSQGHKVGVLMNEAGEVSIDGPRAGTEQVLEILPAAASVATPKTIWPGALPSSCRTTNPR